MRKFLNILAIFLFFFGVIAMMANLACPFVYCHFHGITVATIFIGIGYFFLFDAIWGAVAIIGYLLWVRDEIRY